MKDSKEGRREICIVEATIPFPRIGGESPYLDEHLRVDYYALTSSEIIIVIAARKETRPFPVDVTRLMHPQNCFALRLESDSAIGRTLHARFTSSLKAAKRSAQRAHDRSAPR